MVPGRVLRTQSNKEGNLLAQHRLAVILVAMVCLVSVVGALPSRSQMRFGNPYTAHHEMQTFDEQNERVQAIRIPVYITLRSWDRHPMGLRLRLAGTFAVNDLEVILDEGLERVQVLTFVPGMEFVFPVGENHMLRPFADIGVGTNDATDDLSLVAAAGLRTEFIFPHGRHIFGLEPGLEVTSNAGKRVRDDARINPFVTLTARRILGFRLGGHPPDGEIYFDGGYDFQSFELTSLSANDGGAATQFEVGLGFGYSSGRPRIGPFAIPRLRVGYHFGDVEGFRIRLGGDWLKTVSEWNRMEASN